MMKRVTMVVGERKESKLWNCGVGGRRLHADNGDGDGYDDDDDDDPIAVVAAGK